MGHLSPFPALLLAVSTAAQLTADEPVGADGGLVAHYSFDEGGDRVVRDKSGKGNHGRIQGTVRWVKGISRTGLQLNGKDGLVMIPDSDSLHITDELTISVWFKVNAPATREDAKHADQTIVSKNWSWRCRIPGSNNKLSVAQRTADDEGNNRYLVTYDPIQIGTWYHVVYVYSVSQNRFTVHVNGRKEREMTESIPPLLDVSGSPLLLGQSPTGYNPFSGVIDEVRIYNRALSEDQVLPEKIKVSPLKIASWEQSLRRLAHEIGLLKAASAEADVLTKKAQQQLSSLKNRVDVVKEGSYQSTLYNRNQLDLEFRQLDVSIESLERIVSERQEQKQTLKEVLCTIVKPISPVPILPETFPVDGDISDVLRVVAAPGEYEPGSFVLFALNDINGLKLNATALEGQGTSVPLSAIDIKIVKCWYQSGDPWVSRVQDRSRRTLVPELLLNDASLIKVDRKARENYIKLKFPQGDKYVWISDSEYSGEADVPIEDFPVADSPVLLPVDIEQGSNQQFWVTVRVPDGAKPGIYTGTLNLVTPYGSLGAVTLKLKVLPFRLSQPKTNYDPQRDFICSLYNLGHLDPAGKGYIVGPRKTRQQYTAELKNLYAHGVTSPVMYHPESLVEQLKIRSAVGMGKQPLFLDMDGEDLGLVPRYQPRYNDLITKLREILAITRTMGVPEVYLYGWDERSGDELLRERPIYEAIHEAGARNFVAGGQDQFELVGDLLDLSVMARSLDKEEARKWHNVGHRIVSYDNPQVGLENPEIYRRNYGLRLWMANYDGVMNFAYYWRHGHVWNDFDYPDTSTMGFVYPTAKGVVDTVAWEGFREGLDDVRYASTLRREIEKGKNSQHKQVRNVARAAESWLDDLDVHERDLDNVRLQIINRILKLTASP